MRALRWTAGVALGLTFGLIVLGAWVRASGSGLACPDWPTCYGHWLPLPGAIPAAAGYSYSQVMLEWVHRLIAGVVLGPLVLLIGVLGWRARFERSRMPGYAFALIALLLVQASLGGLTVLDQNSPWSVALHLSTALLLFSVLGLIFERTRDLERSAGGGARPLAVLTWLLALGAMASAAMMTKSGASLACSTWPLCNGALLPDLSDAAIRLNFSHRLLAAGAGLGSLALFFRLRDQPELRPLAGWALALLAIQIALGGLVVALGVPIWSGLLHQAFGVLTFGVLSLLMWRTVPTSREIRDNRTHVGLSRA
jgi:cytochrome c oxidase assembly protein subunit 15